MLGPLIRAVSALGDAQDEQLALAWRQRRRELYVAVEGVEGTSERRVPGQGAEGVQGLGAIVAAWRQRIARLGWPKGRHGLAHLLRPAPRREWSDARLAQRTSFEC